MAGAMSLAGKAIARYRSGGLAALGKSMLGFTRWRYEQWRDRRLDRKYDLQTDGFHGDLAALGASGEHVADSTSYFGIQIPVFLAMMRAVGVDARKHVFVDLGCGKGRALILAAEHGFKRVLGVEFAPPLHRLACLNADTYQRQRPAAPSIVVHLGDAATYPIPCEDVVLFLYNPFGESVTRKVAANIAASLRACPRSLVIAYRNPVHHEIFDGLAGLRAIERNGLFAIYKR